MSEHTKGPWKSSFRKIDPCPKCNPNPGSIGYVRSDEHEICTLFSQNNQQSNARLIASAPELLEALKEIIKENKPTGIYRNEHNILIDIDYIARQAIAKAEGSK